MLLQYVSFSLLFIFCYKTLTKTILGRKGLISVVIYYVPQYIVYPNKTYVGVRSEQPLD